MKKGVLKTTKDFKGKVTLAELRRAHFIIAILSLALVVQVVMSATMDVRLDPVLSAVVVVLLLIVAGISAAIAIALRKK